MSTYEGCATVSDKFGNLLFYTDGVSVFNRENDVMPSGGGLFGDYSSSNSAVIVPKPGDPNKYYIFTTECYYPLTGLHYTLVDMCLDGGLGAVVGAEKNVFLTGQTPEKVTTALHANGKDVWVVTHGWNDSEFRVFLVTAAGVDPTPVITEIGPVHGPDFFQSVGCMTMNRDNNKIAVAVEISGNRIELYDFDNATGVVSNDIVLTTPHFASGLGFGYTIYGVAFSPNSNFIYTSSWYDDNIYQMDITSGDAATIEASATVIGTTTGVSNIGAMELGPDNRIYVATQNQNTVGVINAPDELGDACDYVDNGFNLSGETVYAGLPAFVQNNEISYQPEFEFIAGCAGGASQFSFTSDAVYDEVLWDFGDLTTTTDFSSLFDATYNYSDTGTYTVTLIFTIGCFTDTAVAEIIVNDGALYDLLPADTSVCIEDVTSINLLITAPLTDIVWSTGSTSNEIEVAFDGTYTVSGTDDCGIVQYDTIVVDFLDCIVDTTTTEDPTACFIKFPNAFSPNGDGFNEEFNAVTNQFCLVEQFELQIYSRWGELIFSSSDINIGWNGFYQNTQQEIGSYVYVAKATIDSMEMMQSGTVTLLR
jgi:gliding motility-associated-like protein